MIVYPILLWVIVFGATLAVLPDSFAKPVTVAAREGGESAETGRADPTPPDPSAQPPV